MGKPIAGINKLPFGIDGIKVTCAILPDGEVRKDLFIYKQRSHNIYDLIDKNGMIYQFYKITINDKTNKSLPLDLTKYDDYLQPNTFCIKAYQSCQVVGYVQKFLLNKIILGDGSIAGASLTECEKPYIIVEQVYIDRSDLDVELEREFNLFDNFMVYPVNSSPESLIINMDDTFKQTQPGIYYGTELGKKTYTVSTQNGLSHASGNLNVVPVSPKLIIKPQLHLNVYDEPIEVEATLVDYYGTDTNYKIVLKNTYNDREIMIDKDNTMRVNPLFGGSGRIHAETEIDAGTEHAKIIKSNICEVIITEPDIEITDIITSVNPMICDIKDETLSFMFSPYPRDQTMGKKFKLTVEDPTVLEIVHHAENYYDQFVSFLPLKIGKTKINIASVSKPSVFVDLYIEIVDVVSIYTVAHNTNTELMKGVMYPVTIHTIPETTYYSTGRRSFKSSDTNVISEISDSIVPINTGTADLITKNGDLTHTLNVTVTDVEFNETGHEITLNKGEEYELIYILRNSLNVNSSLNIDYDIDFRWIEGDFILGELSEKRLVTLDTGSTTISLYSPLNRIRPNIKITVIEGLQFKSKVSFVDRDSSIKIGDEFIIFDTNINPIDIVMYSENKDVVNIENGNYVFGKPGVAKIIAYVKNTSYKVSKFFVVNHKYFKVNKINDLSDRMDIDYYINGKIKVDSCYNLHDVSPTQAYNNLITYEFKNKHDPMIPFIYYYYDILERRNIFFVAYNDLISDENDYRVDLNITYIDNNKYSFDMFLNIRDDYDGYRK